MAPAVSTKRSSTFSVSVGVIPIAVAFCGLAATIVATRWVAIQQTAQLRARSDSEARHVAAQLKVGILQTIEPLHRVAAWWLLQGRPLAPEDWQSDAELFI